MRAPAAPYVGEGPPVVPLELVELGDLVARDEEAGIELRGVSNL